MDLNHWPLGYEPNELPDCSTPRQNTLIRKNGWGARIRTSECQDQNLVPYRLATPQQKNIKEHREALYRSFLKKSS